MAQTRMMRADEIVNAFNTSTEHKYWKASIAGTRTNPEAAFNSRSTMVRVAYSIARDDFTVSFTRTDAAFGDFLASAQKALVQILACLQAAGLPFVDRGEDAVLRLEYNPSTKRATVHTAGEGDDWLTAEPLPFKEPDENNTEIPIDATELPA